MPSNQIPSNTNPDINDQNTNSAGINQQQNVDQRQQSVDLSTQENLPGLEQKFKFLLRIFANMKSGTSSKLLITGDTGIGKTSTAVDLGKILGIPIVVLEVPQIIEEDVIQIPFLINSADQRYRGLSYYNKEGEAVDASGLEIVYSQSKLKTTMLSLQKLSDVEYQNNIKSYPRDLQILIAYINKRVPGIINDIRSKVGKILFIDEFLRKASPSIRNVLRLILNSSGKENEIITDDTYVFYGTNIEDEGLDRLSDLSKHSEFSGQLEHPTPSVDTWLYYSASRSSKPIKKDVYEVFKQFLTTEALSSTFSPPGASSDQVIRISPRRWTQILFYINNAYPFEKNEAKILWTTLSRQFRNESRKNEYNPSFKIFESIFDNLLVRSGMSPSLKTNLSATRWRELLSHQIQTAVDIGKDKKYVPVLVGTFGIGKSSYERTLELPPFNLRVINVTCTGITTTDVAGIPLPGSVNAKGSLEGRSSKPPLYVKIMQGINSADSEFLRQLKNLESKNQLSNIYQSSSVDEVYNKWRQQKYRYIVFFDEFNRVQDQLTFNAIRRVVLEKEFNEEYKMPDDCLVFGAMNFDDPKGIQKLTRHIRDAIDIVDVSPDWKATAKFIKEQVYPATYNEVKNKSSADIALKIVLGMPESNKFTNRAIHNDEYSEYQIMAGNFSFYFSPRSYDNLFRDLASSLDITETMINNDPNMTNDEIVESLVDAATGVIMSAFQAKMNQENLDLRTSDINSVVDIYVRDMIKDSMNNRVNVIPLNEILSKVFDPELQAELEKEYIDDINRAKKKAELTKTPFTKPKRSYPLDNNDAFAVRMGLSTDENVVTDSTDDSYRNELLQFFKENMNTPETFNRANLQYLIYSMKQALEKFGLSTYIVSSEDSPMAHAIKKHYIDLNSRYPGQIKSFNTINIRQFFNTYKEEPTPGKEVDIQVQRAKSSLAGLTAAEKKIR